MYLVRGNTQPLYLHWTNKGFLAQFNAAALRGERALICGSHCWIWPWVNETNNHSLQLLVMLSLLRGTWKPHKSRAKRKISATQSVNYLVRFYMGLSCKWNYYGLISKPNISNSEKNVTVKFQPLPHMIKKWKCTNKFGHYSIWG